MSVRPSWNDALVHGRSFDTSTQSSLEPDLAALLIDSVFRDGVAHFLRLADLRESPAALLFAQGRLAATEGDNESATRTLTEAQAKLGPGDDILGARIAFELGCLYIARRETAAAEAVLLAGAGEGGPRKAADLAHLGALIAEAQGDRSQAIRLYRTAIGLSEAALTPMTHVLALRNLAETICHQSPHEATTLCDRAIDLVETRQLDPGVLPALLNTGGYALTCTGALSAARARLARAHEEAEAHGRHLISLFALFNTAIVDELEGDVRGATARLEQVRSRSIGSGFDELRGWSDVRRAWLALLRDGADAAERVISAAALAPIHQDAVATIYAVARISRGQEYAAASELGRLADEALARSDEITAFVLLLWQAVAQDRTALRRTAMASVDRACRLAADRSLRLSPNWWSGDLTLLARNFAAPEHHHVVRRLIDPGNVVPLTAAAPVDVLPDGNIRVGRERLPESAWRQRTGRKVLARLLRMLADAYPASLPRDELADRLWPESEGDRAIRNLYGATKDLKVILRSAPGLDLHVRAGRYSLRARDNVRLDGQARVRKRPAR